MDHDYKLFRRFDAVKRLFLLFFILYVVAALSTAEVRAALPSIGAVVKFYIKLAHAFFSVFSSGGR